MHGFPGFFYAILKKICLFKIALETKLNRRKSPQGSGAAVLIGLSATSFNDPYSITTSLNPKAIACVMHQVAFGIIPGGSEIGGGAKSTCRSGGGQGVS